LPQEIIIIGAGIIGLSSAYELAKSGAKVTVLERGTAGKEASWAGGGILFPLLPWDYPEEVTSLAQAGASLYREWSARLQESSGIDPEYSKCGMTVLPGVRSMEKADAWCTAHGMRHFGGASGEFVLPDVAQVRNPRLLQALRKTLENMGVGIIEHCAVHDFVRKEGKLSGLRISDGSVLTAERYVVCAGAWSGEMLGRKDIFPVKGQMLLFDAKGLLDTILLKDDIYLIPRRDGLILAGSTLEYCGFDKSLTSENHLRAKASEMLPGLERLSPVKHWAGLRPGSPGNIPTIARHPEFENLYLNIGHFRYGVTMAPAAAKMLSGIVFGES
jgi:glycine oxidase